MHSAALAAVLRCRLPYADDVPCASARTHLEVEASAAQCSAEVHQDEFGKLRLQTAKPKTENFLLPPEAPDAPSVLGKSRPRGSRGQDTGEVVDGGGGAPPSSSFPSPGSLGY